MSGNGETFKKLFELIPDWQQALQALLPLVAVVTSYLQDLPVAAMCAWVAITWLAASSAKAIWHGERKSARYATLSTVTLAIAAILVHANAPIFDSKYLFDTTYKKMANVLIAHGSNVDSQAMKNGVKKGIITQAALQSGEQIIWIDTMPYLFILMNEGNRISVINSTQIVEGYGGKKDKKGLPGGINLYRQDIEKTIGSKIDILWYCGVDAEILEGSANIVVGPVLTSKDGHGAWLAMRDMHTDKPTWALSSLAPAPEKKWCDK